MCAGEKWGCNVWLRQRPVLPPEDEEPPCPWVPLHPPPRLTAAYDAGQTSTLRKERCAS